jgi:hypothetical protein
MNWCLVVGHKWHFSYGMDYTAPYKICLRCGKTVAA